MPPPDLGLTKLISILLVASTLSLLFISCNKDEIKTQVVADHDAKYDTYYKFLSFIERMEGKVPDQPFILPRTNYTASDVRDYVEGALNLEYADAGLTWASHESTTDTFTIVLTSGYATQGALDALFAKARDSASVFFYSIAEEDKFPNLYDVDILHESSSSAQFTVTTMVGKVHRVPNPFGEDDSWTVITDKGLCTPDDDNNPQPIYDAGIMEANALNDYYNMYGAVFYTHHTPVSSLDLDGQGMPVLVGWGALNPEDPTPGDFIVDYKTFKSSCTQNSQQCADFMDENGVYCIPPDGMNFYFQSIIGIFTSYSLVSGLSVDPTTQINLVTEIVSNIDVKHWECNAYFGTINYKATGNDFPYALPPCCP